MIKLICFLKRKPGMGVEDFRDHWLNRHGPLIRTSADFARHIVRYEQNHRLDADYARENGGGFDGVTVQWFRKVADFYAIATEPSYRDTIFVDEERFLDRRGLRFILTGESHVVIDRARSTDEARVKLLCLLTRHPDLDRAGFHQHWQWHHGPLFRDTPELSRHLIGYEQNHRLEQDYARDAGGGYDGVAETWFASLEEFERFCGEPAYAAVAAPDEDFLLDRDAIQFVLTRPAEVILS
jgi:hypothetical protein